MNRKLLRTPTRKWEFLRTRSLVTLRSQHAGPRKCPISTPTIYIINAINTIWLCEEDPSHRIIMTPTFRLPKAILREEEFWKGIRLQEEPREEAPPKEEEKRLEFLEMFQEGKNEKKKKRSRQVFFRLIANSWAKPPSALRLVSPSSSLYWIPLAPVALTKATFGCCCDALVRLGWQSQRHKQGVDKGELPPCCW